MIQFYFLSVLLNAVTGAMLFFGPASRPETPAEDGESRNRFFPPFAYSETFRFALGVTAIAVGVLKLLSPVKDDVPFIGDIFPAAAGVIAGFDLIYENIRMKKISEVVVKRNTSIRRLLESRTYIGITAIAAAALHFLFPAVIII